MGRIPVFVPPKQGAKIKVIGGGLPRSGTNSFCAAVSYLLDGPAYHVGVQTVQGTSDADILDWIKISEDWLADTPEKRKQVIQILRSRLDGYIAVTDPPSSLLVPELLEAFPDARVVCTVRDRDSWANSMMMLVRLSKPRLSAFLFYWVPVVRWCPKLWNLLTPMWVRRYGLQVTQLEAALAAWDQHHDWLRSVVPKEKLFFVDVKDGWEPLCRALDVPVPQDTPFPRLNDAKDIEAVFQRLAMQGMIRWGIALAAVMALGSFAFAVISGIL